MFCKVKVLEKLSNKNQEKLNMSLDLLFCSYKIIIILPTWEILGQNTFPIFE